MNFKILILSTVLLSIYFLEKLKPQVVEKRFTWGHDKLNFGIGLFNNVALTYAFLRINSLYTQVLLNNNIGILNVMEASGFVRGISSFLALDLSIYIWHVLLHRYNFLYRFHAVHHTDTGMNVTTSFRFHFGELMMGNFFRFLVIGIFGISFSDLVLYEVFLNINVYIHHSNLEISPIVDKIVSKLIISPYVHRVHHSVIFKEGNSNFGSVFIFWDKLFNTYTDPSGRSVAKFGDFNFRGAECQRLSYILLQPFKTKN